MRASAPPPPPDHEAEHDEPERRCGTALGLAATALRLANRHRQRAAFAVEDADRRHLIDHRAELDLAARREREVGRDLRGDLLLIGGPAPPAAHRRLAREL